MFNSLSEDISVTYLDVGAAGELSPRWNQVAKNINFVGFEPHSESRIKVESLKHSYKSKIVHGYALGSKNQSRNLNQMANPFVSSFLMPNIETLSRYPNHERFEVVANQEVQVSTIDEFGLKADFIKLDVQGSELDVLIGAKQTLPKVYGLEIEIEFTQIYKEQPLFGEICNFLEKYQLYFIDFTNISRWERKSLNEFGRSFFGDALFLREPESINFKELGDDQLNTYLMILLLYKRFDLIEVVTSILMKQKKQIDQELQQTIRKHKRKSSYARFFFKVQKNVFRLVDPTGRLHYIY